MLKCPVDAFGRWGIQFAVRTLTFLLWYYEVRRYALVQYTDQACHPCNQHRCYTLKLICYTAMQLPQSNTDANNSQKATHRHASQHLEPSYEPQGDWENLSTKQQTIHLLPLFAGPPCSPQTGFTSCDLLHQAYASQFALVCQTSTLL